MARGDAVPEADDVTRWVKPRYLGKDDEGAVIVDDKGRPKVVAPAAFELAPDEAGLSVTWLQPFGATRAEHLPSAAEAFKQSIPSKNISKKSVFAVAKVSEVLVAGKSLSCKLRLMQDPVPENDGHAEIRRYPVEMGLLQLALATETFVERYLYSDVSTRGWSPS